MYFSDFYKDTLEAMAPALNIVCMDATHNTNEYAFLLVTLMVKDQTGMGCPVAHCICTSDNEEILFVFLNEVRKKVGRILVRYFMSDMAPQYYKTFVNVMHKSTDDPFPTPEAIRCMWHVIKAWYSKARDIIKDTDIVEGIMNSCRAMIHTKNGTQVKQVIHISK